jgi:hypothetical protein
MNKNCYFTHAHSIICILIVNVADQGRRVGESAWQVVLTANSVWRRVRGLVPGEF